MIGLLLFVLAVLVSPFKSKLRLEAENAVLRRQLNVLSRRLHGRARLTNGDRWFFIQLYRWFPSILQVLTIIRPETLVGWHRAGFRHYWRWKSRSPGGRPQIETDPRALIRRMSMDNRRRLALHLRRRCGVVHRTLDGSGRHLRSLQHASRRHEPDGLRPQSDFLQFRNDRRARGAARAVGPAG